MKTFLIVLSVIVSLVLCSCSDQPKQNQLTERDIEFIVMAYIDDEYGNGANFNAYSYICCEKCGHCEDREESAKLDPKPFMYCEQCQYSNAGHLHFICPVCGANNILPCLDSPSVPKSIHTIDPLSQTALQIYDNSGNKKMHLDVASGNMYIAGTIHTDGIGMPQNK